MEVVEFTVANSLNRLVFLDKCTGGVEGRQRSSDDWGSRDGGGRLCAYYATRADYYLNMLSLPRGEIVVDTFLAHGLAVDVDWRIRIRVLDWRAFSVRDEPFTSPVFRVRP